MIDPQKVNLDELPKKLCDGALGGHNKEIFSFVLTSGNSLDSFAATPQIMKSISQWLQAQVETYEKTFGEIDMAPHQIASPIQVSDL